MIERLAQVAYRNGITPLDFAEHGRIARMDRGLFGPPVMSVSSVMSAGEGQPPQRNTHNAHNTLSVVGRCDSRGCKDPARDCGTGTYCQRHAKMHGAAWLEDTKE